MDSDYDKNYLLSFFGNLIGKICWSVIAGSGGGSMISMTFGRPFKRERVIKNPTLSKAERDFEGEFKVFVENANWELELFGETICDNLSENSLRGPMVVGLRRLVGLGVESIDFIDQFYSVRIGFVGGFALKIFCLENADKEVSNYSVFDLRKCVVVFSHGKLGTEKIKD